MGKRRRGCLQGSGNRGGGRGNIRIAIIMSK